MEVIPNVHLIPNVIANPYLIIDPQGLTLIDAGLRGSDRKILRYLAERGFSAHDLTRIILTHADPDHVGGLQALKRASGARVCASRIEADAISKGIPSRGMVPTGFVPRAFMAMLRPFLKAAPVDVDEILSDGQVLTVLGGLQVLDTPGHTPGHISLFAPTSGVLFCGDSIVSRGGDLVGSIPANTWNQAQAAISVRKQESLGARVVCSGHGPVVRDAIGRIPMI
jgi:glyoxylase-like metal-dependent hydrolase (beta-lactamase superfamily II)